MEHFKLSGRVGGCIVFSRLKILCNAQLMSVLFILRFIRGMAKDCFRAIIARFSRDVWRKEVIIRRGFESSASGQVNATACIKEIEKTVLEYRQKLVSQHFSFELTRTVGEMIKADIGAESFPHLPGSHLSLHNPVLEFVKNVIHALRLDVDVESEVNALNRSLLSQIGTQEYDPATKWQNPCADFILPDVFCPECHQSCDVNLCILPQMDDDETEVKFHFWA
jgi:DNA polymerase epsilon subunit 1